MSAFDTVADALRKEVHRPGSRTRQLFEAQAISKAVSDGLTSKPQLLAYETARSKGLGEEELEKQYPGVKSMLESITSPAQATQFIENALEKLQQDAPEAILDYVKNTKEAGTEQSRMADLALQVKSGSIRVETLRKITPQPDRDGGIGGR